LTVRTPPTGLTLVGCMDPASTLLRDRFAEIADEYKNRPWPPDESVDEIENSREAVASALQFLR
jgi:hypothetical protein